MAATTANGVVLVEMLSMEFVTEYFGVTSRTVRNWIADRKLAMHKFGNRVLFDPKDVQDFKRRCRHAAVGEKGGRI